MAADLPSLHANLLFVVGRWVERGVLV